MNKTINRTELFQDKGHMSISDNLVLVCFFLKCACILWLNNVLTIN